MSDIALPADEPEDRTVELVSYLDGELDEATRRRVEQRLQTDPSARQELAQLGRAWDALDLLPPLESEAASVHSTMTMVAMAAEEDARAARRRIPWQRAALAAAMVGGLCVAAGAGYRAASWWRPDPNQALLDDLTVLEHLDALRQVPDAEAVRQLHAAGVFLPEGEP